MTQLKTEIFEKDGAVVVHLIGELDASSSIAVDSLLEEAVARQPRALLLNFNQLSYISSAGLGAVLTSRQTCTLQRIPLVLVAMQPRIRSVFEALGLETVFTITNNEQEAFAALPNTPGLPS